MSGSDPIDAALARNTRFLETFVERLDLCPFARQCREGGRLERRVLTEAQPVSAEVANHLAELASPAWANVDIALLIFPHVQWSYPAFERFATELRTRTETFFVVAFHPEAPGDATSPERLVSFLRRSPDPMLQLVRVSTVERARGTGGGKVFAPATALPATPRPSTSERIARTNHETVLHYGFEELKGLLRRLRE